MGGHLAAPVAANTDEGQAFGLGSACRVQNVAGKGEGGCHQRVGQKRVAAGGRARIEGAIGKALGNTVARSFLGGFQQGDEGSTAGTGRTKRDLGNSGLDGVLVKKLSRRTNQIVRRRRDSQVSKTPRSLQDQTRRALATRWSRPGW